MTCDTEYTTPVLLGTSQQKPFPDTGGAFVFQMETTLERFLEMVGVLFDGIELLGLCPIGDYNIDLLKALDRKMYQYPIGAIFPFAGTTPPDGFVLCDGTEYLEVDYPDAYDALVNLRVTEQSKIKVPDMRGRFLIGSSPPFDYPIGKPGGNATVTLQQANIPPHPHSYFYPNAGALGAAAGGDFNALTDVPSTLPTGDWEDQNDEPVLKAEPINVMPPYVGVNFIIFLGA